jgi:1A family penicillin-binding protein
MMTRRVKRSVPTGPVLVAVLFLALLIVPTAQAAPGEVPVPSTRAAQVIANLTELAGEPPFLTTRIFDRHGNLLYEIADRGRRTVVTLDQMPPHLIQATIATEDNQFYANSGIDLGAIARAAWQNFQAGEIVSGGSTITQQLARLLLLDEDARYEQTIQRKVREALLAVQLNQRFSKDEILEMYLNTVYYGNQAYGIGAAARTYLNKDVSELSLAESALLVGIPQAPNRLNPFVDPEDALRRQRVVLNLMQRAGYVDGKEVAAALAEDLVFASPERGTLRVPHFVDYVRGLLLERYGPDGTRQGLQVYTSIDLRFQELAEEIAHAQVIQSGAEHDFNNAAVIIINPPTGQILAMVGSVDYYAEAIDGQVNMTLAPRQLGSAMKPVLYAAAFDRGWTPASIVWDTPARYPLARGEWYSPRNVTGRFYGPLRLRSALANSLNVSAIKLLNSVGVDAMLSTARQMGINSLRAPANGYGLSLAIGGYEVPLLELTHAYATLANGGAYVPLAGVTEIRDGAGQVIFSAQPPDPPEYGVAPSTAFQVTSILSDTRSRQLLFGQQSPLDTSRPAAVKTGTSDGWRDSLTVGYTPYLAVGVWLGNSDSRLMREAPGYLTAGPIWHDIMEGIWADADLHASLGYDGKPLPDGFSAPPGVETVPVCELGSGITVRNCSLAYAEVLPIPSRTGAGRASAAEADQAQGLGYCLPTVPADSPARAREAVTFIPLPADPQDAAAARQWASANGLRLLHADDCNPTPVDRSLAQLPPRPEAERLIDIPEPEPETAAETATVVGPLRVDGRASLREGLAGLNIRTGPGIANAVDSYLLPGHTVMIREGPRQVGPSPWFRIENLDTDATGWVNGDYLRSLSPPVVEPDEEAPAVVEPGGGLEIGGRARLVSGIRGLNMRTGPGVGNAVRDFVRPGDIVLVEDGPQTASGGLWYAILDLDTEVEGWVNSRYLVPAPSP